MPEGLEKDLKVQDLADLLAYLRSARPAVKPKALPATNRSGHSESRRIVRWVYRSIGKGGSAVR